MEPFESRERSIAEVTAPPPPSAITDPRTHSPRAPLPRPFKIHFLSSQPAVQASSVRLPNLPQAPQI
jgi:hypothetical protein